MAGTADVAVFSGNALSGGYAADFITYGGYNAIRITDVNTADGDDGTDILIGVETGRFADGDVSLLNGAPALDLNADHFVTTTTNFSENFGSTSYTQDDGAWTQDWIESGDDNSSTSDNGQIRINSNELQFDNGNNAGNSNGASITRAVNLSGASSATLSFDYDEFGFDAADNETVLVQFAADGINFTTLQTINSTSGSGSSNLALTGTLGATSAIRFVVSAVNGNNDIVSIDNINIAKNTSTFVPGTPGNNFVTSYTEDGVAAAISEGPSITDDGTQIRSAKVVLTNRKAGDVLNVNDIGGDGISSSLDTSDPSRITITLTGIATLAAYQAAIQAITFANTSQNPDTTDRLIDVTVNDGLFNSNVAQATVHVAAVDDVVNANNDAVVTNWGTTAFVIPEWALLANDTDPDNVIDITGESANNGLSVSLTALDTVTIQDTAGGANTFTYTATGGPATDTASVSVTQDAGDISTGGGSQILVGNNNGNAYSAGSGNDIILAGGGNDSLTGGSGVDILSGGAGNDQFIFDDGDSGTGSSRDVIKDFVGGVVDLERIDLSAIDANTTVGGGGGGGQAFTFIATAAFSDTTAGGQLAAGQVRYELFELGW